MPRRPGTEIESDSARFGLGTVGGNLSSLLKIDSQIQCHLYFLKMETRTILSCLRPPQHCSPQPAKQAMRLPRPMAQDDNTRGGQCADTAEREADITLFHRRIIEVVQRTVTTDQC